MHFARRAQDAIPVVTRTTLVTFTLPWQVQPPRDSRTIVIKGTFDIVPDAPAALRPQTDLPNGDVHQADNPLRSLLYPSDFVIFKPKADITLKGHAYPPGGASPASLARFRFGRGATKSFDRAIAVFGDRSWQEAALVRLAPTEPRRFQAIPLTYENAFGGPAYDKNPAGTGHASSTEGRLPNLEDPDHLIKSPADCPEPAGFGAIPALWNARWSKLGTYDDRWHKTRWPYFPDDVDWTHAQAAPPAQQLDYLNGDEPFELTGMHPKLPRIDGSLPRLRPRCFAQRTSDAGGAFLEVLMRLDTASFDVDEMKLNLVWRGLLEVADDQASDIAELFVLVEDLRAPEIDLPGAHAQFLAQRTPLPPVEESPDADTAPANDGETTEQNQNPAAHVAERLDAAGVPAVAPTTLGGSPSTPSTPSLGGALSPNGEPQVGPILRDDSIRPKVEELLAQDAPLDELDLAGADLSDLDFSRRSLRGTSLQEARLVRCRFNGADLTGAQLSGADLTAAVLDNANLERADFTGALLDDASLRAASITEADFTGISGERASLHGATGASARFTEANLKQARFDGANIDAADFTKAAIDGAIFDGATLKEIRLYDARGERVSLKDTTLDGARADGVYLVQSSLQNTAAPGSVWDKAALDGSTFLGAQLRGAGFVKASCKGAIFSGADLAGARLGRADLTRAAFLRANLMEASLEGADLTGADLRAANLHGAETWKAKLDGADLELAVVTQTKLKERG